MMKKITVMSVMLAVLLTGCGIPNPVADTRKELDIKFISSTKDVTAAEETIREKNENVWSNAQLKEFVSEERKKQLDQLFIELDKMAEENIIQKYSKEEPFYWKVPMEKIALENNKEMNFEIHTDKFLEEFTNRLERIGYEGLQGVELKTINTNLQIVSDGVSFWLHKDDSCYNVYVTINNTDLYTPVQFAEVLSQCYKDGFNVQKVEIGGYIERFVLGSSDDKKSNPFTKAVHVYMKDGKFLQMEIYAWGNGKETDFIFSEREKATMVNLLTWISKDAAASEKFVSEITSEGEGKGEIGSCDWYRIQEKNWGDNEREMAFRFVER